MCEADERGSMYVVERRDEPGKVAMVWRASEEPMSSESASRRSVATMKREDGEDGLRTSEYSRVGETAMAYKRKAG